MLGATQIELMNTGVSIFVCAAIFVFLGLVVSRLYSRIHETIGADGKAFFGIVSAILMLIPMIGILMNTQGCPNNSNMQTGVLVIRTGIDPNAPPVTLHPEPLNVPVRLQMVPQLEAVNDDVGGN